MQSDDQVSDPQIAGRSRRPLFASIGGLVVVVAVVIAAVMLGGSRTGDNGQQPDGATDPMPGDQPAEQPPDAPDSAENDEPADEPELPSDGTITVAELGTELIVVSASGVVEAISADGASRTLTDEFADELAGTDRPRLVPDRNGGFIWQPLDNAAEVAHVNADGHSRSILSVGDDERIALVGVDHTTGAALVIRTTGNEPDTAQGDLLGVPLGTDPPQTLVTAMTGWESGLSFAARYAEDVLYGLYDAAFEGVFVLRSASEPTLLLEAGEITGEYVRGVTIANAFDGQHPTAGVALIERAAGYPEQPTARLLLVDLPDEEVTAEVEVPLQLGDDTWNVPRDVSATGSWVLVNRFAEGRWLEPLVYNRDSGQWAVLTDVEGRAFLH